MSVAEVSGKRAPPVVEVLLRVPKKKPKKKVRPRRLRWFEESDSADVVALMRQAAVSDARLRRVTVPASAPELLVNLGHGSANDMALMERSIIERVKRIRGVQLQSTVRWTGRS